MAQTIVACKTIQDEVETILRQEHLDLPVFWIPSGLHNIPAELNQKLQETLDQLPPTDHVLLAMAYCGNSVSGLRTGSFRLTVPRVDDCISLLLSSVKSGNSAYKGVYFMTAGWLRGERSLMTEYAYAVEKYGRRRGEQIFQVMFQHYTDVALLDSGCFDKTEAEVDIRRTAQLLNLRYREIPGDLSLLRRLLCGPWPDDSFLTVDPYTEITPAMLTLINEDG